MSSYNLQLLNDKEFQDMFADIIGEIESTHVERFKSGRDQGVDGRIYTSDGGATILQSKHWEKSGLAALLRELKNNESRKVAKLDPKKYIIGTSVHLSRKDKKKIKTIFEPYITSEADIYGNDDICALVSKYPKIERKYYKLWLASFENLKILHSSAIISRSGATIEEINESLSRYVQTTGYIDGAKILEKERVLIIKGEPGVGKTTLAKQLAMTCVVSGFEFYEASDSIVELEGCWDDERKQVYYFDDFLGRNYMEVISGKEDSQIVSFIRRIRRSKNKRFVLTTRTVILNRAALLTDRFKIENVDRNEFELVVDDLTVSEKSYILYNHIWFGELSMGYVDEIYKDRRYREIVLHSNFNPRLIEFITDAHKASVTSPDKYWDYIQGTLENPQDIWSGVFERQLSEDAQWLVLATVFCGGSVRELELRRGFERMLTNQQGLESGKMQRWLDSFRLCVGSVLNRTCRLGEVGDRAVISLFNPAVGDFVLNKFGSSSATISEVVEHMASVNALFELSSMKKSGILTRSVMHSILENLCNRCPPSVDNENDFRISIAVLVAQESFEVDRTYWIRWSECIADSEFEYSSVSRMARFLSILLSLEYTNTSRQIYAKYWELLLQDASEFEEYMALSPLFLLLRDSLGQDYADNFRTSVLEFFHENIDNWVREEGILDDYSPTETGLDDANDALDNAIESKADDLGFEFESGEIYEIAAEVDVDDILSENDYEDWDDSVSYVVEPESNSSDDSLTIIDDIFNRS